MAVTIKATPKGTDSNCYVELADAQAYFDERLNVDDWADATADQQAQALIMATRRLEQENYRGRRTTQEQALQWPRAGTFDRDGFTYDQDLIPVPVERATYELALELLKGDILADSGLQLFDAISVGPIDIDVRHVPTGDLPPQVLRELEGLLTSSPAGPRLRRA